MKDTSLKGLFCLGFKNENGRSEFQQFHRHQSLVVVIVVLFGFQKCMDSLNFGNFIVIELLFYRR